jgi:5-formyltetrahydrofolate cyclo-ligase
VVLPADRKRQLREFGRQQRRDRSTPTSSATDLADAALAVASVAAARSVSLYVGVSDEPDTSVLLERLRRSGVRVLLPVVLPGLDLDWAEYEGPDALMSSAKGLREPSGPRLGRAAIGSVDVVLAPGLAVDAEGRRLGQGGGCYDRALTRVPDETAVLAIVFAEEVVPGPLPDEPHDRRVDGVVTAS